MMEEAVLILAAAAGVPLTEACLLRWDDLSDDLGTVRTSSGERPLPQKVRRAILSVAPFGDYVFTRPGGAPLTPEEVLLYCG